MEEKNLYPYTFRKNKTDNFLLWIANDTGDVFKLNDDGTLLISCSQDDIKNKLKTDSHLVNWNEGAFIDFDEFWFNLNSFRAGDTIPTEECSNLIEGWNFIEDMIRTFGLNELSQKLHTPLVNKTYKKLFYGNNLEAVTPADSSYSPIISENELTLLIEAMIIVWDGLSKFTYAWGESKTEF